MNIAGSVINGDVKSLSQNVGALISKGTCKSCALAGATIVSSNDKAFIEAVVGRGFLVFVTTGSPSLVIADAATNLAKNFELTRPPPNPLQPAPPADRGRRTFRIAEGLCSVLLEENNFVTVGWVTPPVLISSDGGSSTFPGVDLVQGDILEIDVMNKLADCPAPPKGQSRPSKVRMTYEYSQLIPTAQPGAMTIALIGTMQ
ncbi:hypothetical protein [Paracidovorax citrulli]